MQFLTTVCIAAIAAALFRMLVPENKAAKQVSLLIASVFLLTAFSAFSGAEIDLTTNAYEISSDADYIGFSGEVNKSLQKKICADMSEKVCSLLNENGFFPEQVHVIVNISGLYSIDITQVKLVFGTDERVAAKAAAQLLADELPKDIAVTYELKEGS